MTPRGRQAWLGTVLLLLLAAVPIQAAEIPAAWSHALTASNSGLPGYARFAQDGHLLLLAPNRIMVFDADSPRPAAVAVATPESQAGSTLAPRIGFHFPYLPQEPQRYTLVRLACPSWCPEPQDSQFVALDLQTMAGKPVAGLPPGQPFEAIYLEGASLLVAILEEPYHGGRAWLVGVDPVEGSVLWQEEFDGPRGAFVTGSFRGLVALGEDRVIVRSGDPRSLPVASREGVERFEAPGDVQALAWSPERRLLAGLFYGNAAPLLNLYDPQLRVVGTVEATGGDLDLAWAANGTVLLIGTRTGIDKAVVPALTDEPNPPPIPLPILPGGPSPIGRSSLTGAYDSSFGIWPDPQGNLFFAASPADAMQAQDLVLYDINGPEVWRNPQVLGTGSECRYVPGMPPHALDPHEGRFALYCQEKSSLAMFDTSAGGPARAAWRNDSLCPDFLQARAGKALHVPTDPIEGAWVQVLWQESNPQEWDGLPEPWTLVPEVPPAAQGQLALQIPKSLSEDAAYVQPHLQVSVYREGSGQEYDVCTVGFAPAGEKQAPALVLPALLAGLALAARVRRAGPVT